MTYLNECLIAKFVEGERVAYQNRVYVVHDVRFCDAANCYEYLLGNRKDWLPEFGIDTIDEEDLTY